MAEYVNAAKAAEVVAKATGLNAAALIENALAEVLSAENPPATDIIPTNWTLANEALPPNGEDVLCWYEYFRFGEYNRMYQTFGIGYQFNGNWGGEVAQGQKAKVLAWMPLPRPPKMKRGVTNG